MKQYALVPAKDKSSRCINKNWRDFALNKNLVEYTISTIPQEIFDLVILSTDKADIKPIDNVIIHRRPAKLATKESPVNDLVSDIIKEYKLEKDGYIWILNPTSPFRTKEDFLNIHKMILNKEPSSVISGFKVNPFFWKDDKPMFETAYPRKNTQDFDVEYHIENGQFFVFRVQDFIDTKTWYSDTSLLYRQSGTRATVDIDTEEDFLEARKLA